MKKSTHTLFLEVVEENSIDLSINNSINKARCIWAIQDKIDWSEYNTERMERKLKVITRFVNMMFDEPSSRGKSLKKMIG